MTARASRVMKARRPSTCPLCDRGVRIGQQIGRTPAGWCHVTCIIKAARKLAAVSGPGMIRRPPPDHPAPGGATKEGTTA